MAEYFEDEDDELDSDQPPVTQVVARQALILSAVVCRANLERYPDEEYRTEMVGYIRDWFDELDLWEQLEPREEEIIRAPFGTLPADVRYQATWYVEGLAVLAWALRRWPFPRRDAKVSPVAVTDALDFLAPDLGEWLADPPLRTREELRACREWLYDLHVTLRQFLHYGGDGRPADWVPQYLNVLGIDPASVMADGVLTIDGVPIDQVPTPRVQECEWVVCQHHRASIWLVGTYPLFTELPVDT